MWASPRTGQTDVPKKVRRNQKSEIGNKNPPRPVGRAMPTTSPLSLNSKLIIVFYFKNLHYNIHGAQKKALPLQRGSTPRSGGRGCKKRKTSPILFFLFLYLDFVYNLMLRM
jgi:hypothetical protein